MKRGPLLIAIGSFAVVAAMAAWPVIRIAGAMDSGAAESRESFSALRRAALNVVPNTAGAVGDAWRSEAGSAWRSQDRLLAIVIKGADGEVLYARPGSSPYYRQAPDGLAFEHPEGTTTRFAGPLSSGLSMEALYVTLRQEDVYYPIRDAAIAFTAVLALLVAWLLVVSNARPAVEPAAAEGTPRTEPDDWEPTIPDLIPTESSLYSENPFDEPASPPSPEPVPAVDFLRPADLPTGSLDGPRGLFDADSGLGWEAYLRERLSSELRRSASFEQDLSLLITSLDGASRGDEEFNLFAATARDFFSFKDMAFLFGDGGAALILPNIDVDHALRMSEELLKKLGALFQDRSAGGEPGVFMGLSSRAGRLVDADRIIGEAMAAMSKAKGGGSRIMAFKPDPEKFRAYLAGQ